MTPTDTNALIARLVAVNTHFYGGVETGRELRNPDGPEAAAELSRLQADVERLTLDGIHTCHDQCQRPACVLRRENAALQARVEALEGAAAMSVAEMMRASGRLEIIAGCNEDRRIAAALSGTCDFVRQALSGQGEVP